MVPENDPTTLFTGSGMQPLLPYFLGEPHPKGKRVVNSQKCFRSQDIEEVGDNRHTTFFEMLGNWSFGDYFKKKQLKWFFTFLVDIVKLDPARLYVSIYQGNQKLGIPRDDEAEQIWQELFAQKGITGQRVFAYGKENWWSRSGEPSLMPVGEPGGPDSEVFYDFGPELKIHENSPFADQECHLNCDCGRYLEIGNSVFMTYVKTKQGFEELENKNIDFGGGLERILAAQNNDPDIFKTAFFSPIIQYLEKKAGRSYGKDEEVDRSFRVIADHLRAAVMLAADGVYPSNKEQGYFSRRLIRRAIRYGHMIGVTDELMVDLVPIVSHIYDSAYPKVSQKIDKIRKILVEEEERFYQALDKGLKVFEKETSPSLSPSPSASPSSSPSPAYEENILTSETAFKLYESYGVPLEMSIEEAKNKDIPIEDDIESKFAQLKQSHADQSRQAATGKFKGGLGDTSEATIRYHTATHLLHAALRKILGEHIQQKGSNITAERMRFDFSHPQALTADEIKQVEDQINVWIKADIPMTKQIMSKAEALEAGAIAFFIEKYPDEVSIYTIGNDSEKDWISKEFCGGPHVKRTSEIGPIELFKEQSSGAGVRRIYLRLK